jgi:rhodanese-related sulfurtransferase
MKYSLVLLLLMASAGIGQGHGPCAMFHSCSVPEGRNATPDYVMKADEFLNGAMNNSFYIVTVPEFLNRSKNDANWVIVDIRQPQDYSLSHIKGAINIPFTDLIADMKNIPAGKKVAVYCASNKRSPYGVMALRIIGDRDAWVLLDGVSAWIAAGQPVESSPGPA